jgi:hypothetical protein
LPDRQTLWQNRPLGRSSQFRQGSLHITFDDSAPWPASFDRLQVYPFFRGNAPGYWRSLEPVLANFNRCRGFNRRAFGGRFNYRYSRFISFSLSSGLRQIGHLLARLGNHSDGRTDRNDIALLHQPARQHTGKTRFNFNGRLIGLDLRQHIPFFDRLTLALDPTDQGAFCHVETQFGHGNNVSHYNTSLTAAMTSSAFGIAICSRLRL